MSDKSGHRTSPGFFIKDCMSNSAFSQCLRLTSERYYIILILTLECPVISIIGIIVEFIQNFCILQVLNHGHSILLQATSLENRLDSGNRPFLPW
jgi:hypothetical protein